jgi:hypothetical protein
MTLSAFPPHDQFRNWVEEVITADPSPGHR